MQCHKNTENYFNAALVPTLFLLLATGFQTETYSQTLFRCGNSYQDQPCANGQDKKIVGVSSGTKSAEAGAVDADCAQRGAAAVKIAWRREGGATLDQTLNDAATGRDKELVAAVYQTRGTAPQVRARIESECMAEKERKARYAALLEATKPAGMDAAPTSASTNPPRQSPGSAAVEPLKVNSGAPQKNRACDDLSARLNSLRSQQRNGGSISAMETLKRNAKETEQMMQQMRCS